MNKNVQAQPGSECMASNEEPSTKKSSPKSPSCPSRGLTLGKRGDGKGREGRKRKEGVKRREERRGHDRAGREGRETRERGHAWERRMEGLPASEPRPRSTSRGLLRK